MRPYSRRRRASPQGAGPSRPTGLVMSRISVSHSRNGRNGAAVRALREALAAEPHLADAALLQLEREAGESPGWKLAGRNSMWEATVRAETYSLQGNTECFRGGALRARFEALSLAIAQAFGPDALTRVEARYVYTILLGHNRLAAAELVRDPLLAQSNASSQPALEDAAAEVRFPLDGSIWVTCRHGLSRSVFAYTYVVDSEICRADVTRFETATLLEAIDGMHHDHRRVLRSCLTENAVDALFPAPESC